MESGVLFRGSFDQESTVALFILTVLPSAATRRMSPARVSLTETSSSHSSTWIGESNFMTIL